MTYMLLLNCALKLVEEIILMEFVVCNMIYATLFIKRCGDRIPREARFSAPVQTGPGAHPASCTTGTGSFPWGKRPGPGVDYTHPSSAEVKGRVQLYLYSPSGSSWSVLG